MNGLRVFVIRHGQTDWTRQRRLTGGSDVPLSEEGRRQAEAVAQVLECVPLAAVYASPLARALASAEAIAGSRDLPVQAEAAFREMVFGDWEGLTRREVAARFPEDYETWRTAPHRLRRPGVEPLGEVAERVRRGMEALRAGHEDEAVALVSHAVVIRLIVLAAMGLGPERLWSVDVSPGGITEIEFRGDWATLHRVNTLGHLETLTT